VALQYHDETGARREALGLLERVEMVDGEAILHIRRKDDSTVTVPLSKIRAGRVVPPAKRAQA
jgi:hypothetical protein